MARILHIEDDFNNLLLVRKLLESAGHTVVEASDGLSGIKAAGDSSPDLILMDINLPGLDGNEAATILKNSKHLVDIPIVAITSNAYPGARERCLVAGCDGYIAKPIDVDSFLTVLESYINGRRDHLPLDKKAHFLKEYSRDLALSLEEQAYARHFLEGIIMQSPISTLITDADGVCVLHNERYNRMFNVKGGGIIGSYSVFDDRELERGRHLELVNRVFTENEQIEFQTEYEIAEKDSRIIRFSMFPVLDSAGRLKNAVIQHIDVTDEIRAVQEKERLQEQLFQSQKMESIGTLAGGVAHDYNNLLVGVLGSAELLLKHVDNKDNRYKLLTIIRDSAIKMAELTRSLLAYAQGGKFIPEKVDINHFLGNVLEFTGRVIDRQITVTTDLAPELPPLIADKGQLHQTLINIILNASEAISGRGTVKISTRLAVDVPNFTEFDANRAYVRITVEDSGCGMTDEVLAKLFEPFYSTKGMGRGLGMAAIYGITRTNKAFITAKSAPGAGTTLELFWPAAKYVGRQAAPEPRMQLRKHEAIPAVKDAVTVMVVDDEDIVREVASDILESAGFQVIAVDDGDRAIDELKRNPNVSLVVLDIIMKRMSGRETYPEIKKLHPNMKVLVSSGYDQEGPAAEILKMGADDFIQKPYNINEFTDKINRLLGR